MSKWKSNPYKADGARGIARNLKALEDMKAGAPTWGNGCERRGCVAESVAWAEVDGIVREVCAAHQVQA